MAGKRPFHSVEQLLEEAETTWWSLDPEDWREAFAHHPRIGDLDSLRARLAGNREWSAGEQSGAENASDDMLRALRKANRLYEQRFGFIFIVCATGKSAAEMLFLLQGRFGNNPENEIRIAAAEQARITALRIAKLLKRDE